MASDGSSHHVKTEEVFQVTPELLSSGFMTPMSYDGRRDSLASSQSSYCNSFDFSAPVTPTTCGRSPITFHSQDSFLVVNPYEQLQTMHGLSVVQHQKALSQSDGFYNLSTSAPPPILTGLPYATLAAARAYDFVPRHLERHHDLEDVTLASSGPPWAASSAFSWIEDEYPAPFNPLAANGPEILGDALNEDYVDLKMEAFDGMVPSDAHSHDSFMGHQKEELRPSGESPRSKDEETKRSLGRMRSRIVHRSTGAKGVKLQRSSSGIQKKRKDGPRGRAVPMIPPDCRPGFTIEKKYVHTCKICGNTYKRLEHCRRHEQSHFPVMKSKCEICGKEFPRNDNCIQHYKTHIKFADKKKPRGNENQKYEVNDLLIMIEDERIKTKIRQWALESGLLILKDDGADRFT